jgi:hypothetical protein
LFCLVDIIKGIGNQRNPINIKGLIEKKDQNAKALFGCNWVNLVKKLQWEIKVGHVTFEV